MIAERIHEYFDGDMASDHPAFIPATYDAGTDPKELRIGVDGVVDCKDLAAYILGTPEDQAKHAVATLIALIRLLPEEQQFTALRDLCLDIHDGVRR